MNARNGTSRVTVDMPKTVHRRLKARAARHGKTMRQVILEAIRTSEEIECPYGKHIPNKKTKKVIENIEKRKNLIEAKNAKDLFKKLGI